MKLQFSAAAAAPPHQHVHAPVCLCCTYAARQRQAHATCRNVPWEPAFNTMKDRVLFNNTALHDLSHQHHGKLHAIQQKKPNLMSFSPMWPVRLATAFATCYRHDLCTVCLYAINWPMQRCMCMLMLYLYRLSLQAWCCTSPWPSAVYPQRHMLSGQLQHLPALCVSLICSASTVTKRSGVRNKLLSPELTPPPPTCKTVNTYHSTQFPCRIDSRPTPTISS